MNLEEEEKDLTWFKSIMPGPVLSSGIEHTCFPFQLTEGGLSSFCFLSLLIDEPNLKGRLWTIKSEVDELSMSTFDSAFDIVPRFLDGIEHLFPMGDDVPLDNLELVKDSLEESSLWKAAPAAWAHLPCRLESIYLKKEELPNLPEWQRNCLFLIDWNKFCRLVLKRSSNGLSIRCEHSINGPFVNFVGPHISLHQQVGTLISEFACGVQIACEALEVLAAVNGKS